jgi:hypothetical protein
MGGFIRGSLAVCFLAGCSGGVPQAPEPAAKTARVSPEMLAELRAATEWTPAQVDTVTLPNGERLKRAYLGTGRQHVVIARKNADGSTSISCVNTPAQAEAFLNGASGAEVRQ